MAGETNNPSSSPNDSTTKDRALNKLHSWREKQAMQTAQAMQVPTKANSERLIRHLKRTYPVLGTDLGEKVLNAMFEQKSTGFEAARGWEMDGFMDLFQSLADKGLALDVEKVKPVAERTLNEELATRIEEIIRSSSDQDIQSKATKSLINARDERRRQGVERGSDDNSPAHGIMTVGISNKGP